MSYIILFLINSFSGYDQVELTKESQNLVVFMNFFGLMRMITLAQSAINLVMQFVRTVFKILALHLQDRVKFFLDNTGVKKLKTI